jgi:hypothetical protein
MAFTKIATVTVGSGGASSIDFTSIPNTYTDLMVLISGRSALTGSNYMTLTLNGSSSTFSMRGMFGSGTSTGAFTTPSNYAGENAVSTATSSTFGNTYLYFPNYAGSTNKSYSGDGVGETNASAAFQSIFAGQWATTSSVTSVSLTPISTTWLQYSSATLYGITKGSSGGVTN